MIDALDWLAGHPWLVVGFLLCVIAMGMEYVFTAYRDKRQSEPKTEPPKPRQYRITVEADDGWPLRSYSLAADDAARLVRNLDRDKIP